MSKPGGIGDKLSGPVELKVGASYDLSSEIEIGGQKTLFVLLKIDQGNKAGPAPGFQCWQPADKSGPLEKANAELFGFFSCGPPVTRTPGEAEIPASDFFQEAGGKISFSQPGSYLLMLHNDAVFFDQTADLCPDGMSLSCPLKGIFHIQFAVK